MNGVAQQSRWDLKSFVRADEQQLPFFRSLLDSWIYLHQDFCERAHPYFSWEWGHRERAHLGLLANAAYRLGGIALGESWNEKCEGGQKMYPGWSDLWVRLFSPSGPSTDYLLEGKHAHLNVGSRNIDFNGKILRHLKHARADAEKLRGSSEIIVAVAFLTLCFEGDDLDLMKSKTETLISCLKSENNRQNGMDAAAVIWMGEKDFERSRCERGQNNPNWNKDHFGIAIVAGRVLTP